MSSNTRILALVAIACLAPLMLAGCSSDGDAEEPEEELREIVLLGHPAPQLGETATSLNARSNGRFEVTVGEVKDSTDLVFVTVQTADGPMPGLRQALEDLAGRTVPRVAVLLIGYDEVPDMEIRQLVELETNQLLERYAVIDLDVFHMPGEQLILQIEGLLALPPRNVLFRQPQ